MVKTAFKPSLLVDIDIQMYIYMLLSFRQNYHCCSVATARVLSDLLNKAFSEHRSVRIYCSHRNSATVHIQDENLMYMNLKGHFVVVMLIVTLS